MSRPDHTASLRRLRRELEDDPRPVAAEYRAALDAVLGEPLPQTELTIPAAASDGCWRLFTDGGSRGNPGSAAYGLVLYDPEGREVLRRAQTLGRATNNEAEYAALKAGLELAVQLKVRCLEARLDAELVVKQLSGAYRAKEPRLARARDEILALARSFSSVRFKHIPREQNSLADALANAALDGRDPDTV